MADEDFVFYIHAGAGRNGSKSCIALRFSCRAALRQRCRVGYRRRSRKPYRFTNGASRTFFAQPYNLQPRRRSGQLGAYVNRRPSVVAPNRNHLTAFLQRRAGRFEHAYDAQAAKPVRVGRLVVADAIDEVQTFLAQRFPFLDSRNLNVTVAVRKTEIRQTCRNTAARLRLVVDADFFPAAPYQRKPAFSSIRRSWCAESCRDRAS